MLLIILKRLKKERENSEILLFTGWHGNVEKETRGVAMTQMALITPRAPLPPVIEESMSREF